MKPQSTYLGTLLWGAPLSGRRCSGIFRIATCKPCEKAGPLPEAPHT